MVADQALKTILNTVGWDPGLSSGVEISGDLDPILPTPFRIGETSAASLAAVGLAVNDLWQLRTGRSQGIGVDVRRATASLRSGKYLAMDGAPVAAERTPVMGVYPTKDGRWSYLHCNFPNHRDAALGVLGVPEDREAVRKAVWAGTPWNWRRPSSRQRAPAAWPGRWRNGPRTPNRPPWRLCLSSRSRRSPTALRSPCPMGPGRCRGYGSST